eukprot:scaffold440_cov277-Ochromonas_danica.AAC.21
MESTGLNGSECPICYRTLNKPVSLQGCSHKLCQFPCLKMIASATNDEFCCPVCRSKQKVKHPSDSTIWCFDNAVSFVLLEVEQSNEELGMAIRHHRKDIHRRYAYWVKRNTLRYGAESFVGSFQGDCGRHTKLVVSSKNVAILSLLQPLLSSQYITFTPSLLYTLQDFFNKLSNTDCSKPISHEDLDKYSAKLTFESVIDMPIENVEDLYLPVCLLCPLPMSSVLLFLHIGPSFKAATELNFKVVIQEHDGVPWLVSTTDDFSTEIVHSFSCFADYLACANTTLSVSIDNNDAGAFFSFADLMYYPSDSPDNSCQPLHVSYYQAARQCALPRSSQEVFDIIGISSEGATRIPHQDNSQGPLYWLDNYFVELAPSTLFNEEGFMDLGFISSVAKEFAYYYHRSPCYALQLPKYWLASHFNDLFQYSCGTIPNAVSGTLTWSTSDLPVTRKFAGDRVGRLCVDSVKEEFTSVTTAVLQRLSVSEDELLVFCHGTKARFANQMLINGISLERGAAEQDFSNSNGFYVHERRPDLAWQWAKVRYPHSDLAVLLFYVRKEDWIALEHFDMGENADQEWQAVVSFYRCYDRLYRMGDMVDLYNTQLDLCKYQSIRGPAYKNVIDIQAGMDPIPYSPSFIQVALRKQLAVNLLQSSNVVVMYTRA